MTTAAQDYLKAIHALEVAGGGATVPTNALAARLGVSAASATSMLKKLDTMGLVAHSPYHGAALTKAGRKVALEVVRHHRLLETYLAEALGVPWDAVHAEAEVLEHVLSEDLEDRIAARLGHPTSDPHGHPIPGKDGSMPKLPRRLLWDGSDGERLEIHGVPDDDPVVLRYLAEIGLKPGITVEVTGRGPRGGPLFVRMGTGETHALVEGSGGGVMGLLNRRAFLRGSAGLGALGGAAALRARGGASASAPHRPRELHGGAHAAHSGAVGQVDHARNGFDPHAMLTDFDYGEVSRDRTGRRVREYELVALDKEIEVAPGVFFPAWTYNGRVPGPCIRATEGDRIRVTLVNASAHPHTIHFHGFHPSGMDGVPGAGEAMPGEQFTYDFIAGPFGTHLYHCHSLPLVQHIHRGLYGAYIVDPKGGRPDANESVMVMNAFDTNFDGGNEIYALNTIAFAYMVSPIEIRQGELQRVHLINVTEFDPINSFHLHANFFQLYRTGTSLEPDEFTDTISMGQAERHMLEFSYPDKGDFIFHAHVTEFVDLGWISTFRVV